MYEIYSELNHRFPNVPVTYDSNYDSLNFQTGDLNITALSNNSNPLLILDNASERYQYSIGNMDDVSKFMTDFFNGKIKLSYDWLNDLKRIKIDGFFNTKRSKRSAFTGPLAILVGVFLILLGAVMCIGCVGAFISDGEDFLILAAIASIFGGVLASGIFAVKNNSKIGFIDLIGHLGGIAATTVPITILTAFLSELEASAFFSAVALTGGTAFFWWLGHIVRKAANQHVKESEDIYLDGVSLQLYDHNNQNDTYYHQ